MRAEVDGMPFNLEFVPPLSLPPKAEAEVHLELPSGHGWIRVRCIVTDCVLETRPDCQLIDGPVPFAKVFVAAPESITRPRLSWRMQLLRWLALR